MKSVTNYGIYVGCMHSPIDRNAVCCTWYGVTTDDVLQLNVVSIFRHCCGGVSCEVLHMTTVLFELLCIRDGSFCLDFENDTIL